MLSVFNPHLAQRWVEERTFLRWFHICHRLQDAAECLSTCLITPFLPAVVCFTYVVKQNLCGTRISLLGGMLRARSIHLKPLINTPFVVDAKTWESCNGISLGHIIQAYCTLSRILCQDILIVIKPGLGETHDKMQVHLIGRDKLGAHRTVESCWGKKQQSSAVFMRNPHQTQN